MNLLAIYRAEEFSSGRVDDDRAIMDAVVENIKCEVNDVQYDTCREEELLSVSDKFMNFSYDMILSMARRPETLNLLKQQKNGGVLVINSPEAVELVSHRENLFWLTGESYNPCNAPFWIKPEGYCSEENNVVFVKEKDSKIKHTDKCVYSPHYEGEHIKFYGVGGAFLDVYGGDAILGDDEKIHIIDINDWPSFSSCREDAAKAIAKHCIKKYENKS